MYVYSLYTRFGAQKYFFYGGVMLHLCNCAVVTAVLASSTVVRCMNTLNSSTSGYFFRFLSGCGISQSISLTKPPHG